MCSRRRFDSSKIIGMLHSTLKKKHNSFVVPLQHLNKNTLVIVDAVNVVLDSNDSVLGRSVTEPIRALLSSLGGSWLLLPEVVSF